MSSLRRYEILLPLRFNDGQLVPPENRQFFRRFKEQVKTDFQQLDIWLISYPIDVLQPNNAPAAPKSHEGGRPDGPGRIDQLQMARPRQRAEQTLIQRAESPTDDSPGQSESASDALG